MKVSVLVDANAFGALRPRHIESVPDRLLRLAALRNVPIPVLHLAHEGFPTLAAENATRMGAPAKVN